MSFICFRLLRELKLDKIPPIIKFCIYRIQQSAVYNGYRGKWLQHDTVKSWTQMHVPNLSARKHSSHTRLARGNIDYGFNYYRLTNFT